MSTSESTPTDASAVTSNVDAREVAHYESLSDTWWDQQGPFWPLHKLNAFRSTYLRDVIARTFGRDPSDSKPLGNITVLDVGCGGGILSESMAIEGAEVHGIDVVEKNIAIARHHARDSDLKVRYDKLTATELARSGATYDVVLNMEVVEHVPDVSSLLHDCAQLVRPGGIMVVATLNRTVLSWLVAIVGAEYVLGWLPKGTHRWQQFVPPQELKEILTANAFETIRETGVRMNPVNRCFMLTRSLAVNYMVVARRPG